MSAAVALSRGAPATIVYPSPESRAFYFSVCRDAWLNLPEHEAARFPHERHLRQFCLIRAGHCTHSITVCGSPEAAIEVAAKVRPSKAKDFVLTVLDECVVTVFEARSQAAKAMAAADFYALAQRVFCILAGMLGVDPLELRRHAGRAA